jgi:multidrug efflux pump subunit AcrA (membrane-fusion protein)
MTHFGRKVGFQWIFVGVLLIVGFLGLRWAALSEAQAQDRDLQLDDLRKAVAAAQDRAEQAKKVEERLRAEAEDLARKAKEAATALLPPGHFLEKGKSYSFYGQDLIGPAVVLEEPRENWVKVRTKERGGEEKDQWLNLNTVHRVVPAQQVREKKDADKGAVKATGTVKGIVTLNGKPVGKGKVTFHPETGEAIEADLNEDGSYSAKDVPVGSIGVTIKAEGVPAVYADKNKTPFKFQVSRGENVLDMEVKK